MACKHLFQGVVNSAEEPLAAVEAALGWECKTSWMMPDVPGS
jgi:hypothetical protein